MLLLDVVPSSALLVEARLCCRFAAEAKLQSILQELGLQLRRSWLSYGLFRSYELSVFRTICSNATSGLWKVISVPLAFVSTPVQFRV